MRLARFVPICCLLLGAACGSKASAPVDAQATPEPTAKGPTQGDILGILKVVHQGEIDAGKLALEKTGDALVKEFAQRMIDEHGQGLARVDTLAQKMQLAPDGSKPAAEIAAHHQELSSKLRAKSGSEFDKAYADAMVSGHEDVLKLIRDKLFPEATNEDLRAELKALDEAVSAHLLHAKSLQSALNK